METAIYKTKLETLLAEITTQLMSLGVQDPTNQADWVTAQTDTPFEADPNDVADRVEDYDTKRATLAELETRYKNIVAALAKIENGTYGICEVSGEPISEARLMVNPAARTCAEHMN